MRAPEMDVRLDAERRDPERLKRRVALEGLPDGAMIVWREAPHLVAGRRLWLWSFGAYGEPASRPAQADVAVLTPPSIVAALRAGYKLRPESTPLEYVATI
jgi:hypothetical protein